MLTPAISASRTSVPFVIMSKAVSTQVFGPPFLKRCPLPEATTTGRDALCVIIVGLPPASGLAAAARRPAPVAAVMKSRLLMLSAMNRLLRT